ncbi:hypothetical protein DH2020_047227 [Rehmannia glutinosa]|uniref:PHD-type domain-containing protein n=1 Tax=Rehmannia glutinosa TaxID=99300 RepID=A0ABR0UA26_REHGL
MAREAKLDTSARPKTRFGWRKKSSDESDEDYKVDENEEFDESEDDVCSSLAEDDFEDNLGKFEEDEEEEWVEKKVKKVGRPRARSGFQTRKKNVVVKPRKKKVVYSEQEEEEYDDYYFSGVKQRKKNKVSYKEEEDDDIEVFYRQQEDEFVDEKPRKKSRVSKTETYEDSCNENPREKDKVSYTEEEEYGEYDDSDDEDDEEFTPGEVMKRTTRKPVKKRVLRRKTRSNLFKELRDGNPTSRKKKMIGGWGCGRRRKSNKNSDSDFVSSGSSDYEYTISEEREQVREATEICRRLTTNLRSSSSLKMIKEEELLPSKRKRPWKEGQAKGGRHKSGGREAGLRDLSIRRGEENSQRSFKLLQSLLLFRLHHGVVKSGVSLPPLQAKVYQPSEEELRGYLDPYENVLCTECQQGGDDAFMLLCDLCDSPAHTYCVGLGREVPDGNWYCDGCRPTALASSNTLNPNPDNNASNNLSVGSSPVSVRETFDLNEAYVPDTPLTPTTGHSQSPRHSIGHSQATPPVNGSGAFTLFDRRRIQRQIHHLLNNRIRQFDRSDGVGPASGINLFGTSIARDGAIATQNTVMPAQNIYLQGRLPEVFSPRFSSLRGGALGSQASTSTGHSFGGLSQTEFAGINSRIIGGLGHQQLHPCSGTSNTRADASTSPYQLRECDCYSTFKDISRTSTHTILAVAGGLERHSNGERGEGKNVHPSCPWITLSLQGVSWLWLNILSIGGLHLPVGRLGWESTLLLD